MQSCSLRIDNNSSEYFIPETMNGYGYFIDTETMKFIDISSRYDAMDTVDNEYRSKPANYSYTYKDNTRIYIYTIIAVASFSATVFLFEHLHK